MNITPTSKAPDVTEIQARIDKVQVKMAELGLDFYLCHEPANIFYLCDFANFFHEQPFILLIPARGTPIFLMPNLEETHVRIRAVGALEFVNYFEFPAPADQRWSDRLKCFAPAEVGYIYVETDS